MDQAIALQFRRDFADARLSLLWRRALLGVDQADDAIHLSAALVGAQEVQLVDGAAAVPIADSITGEQLYARAGKHERLLASLAQ